MGGAWVCSSLGGDTIITSPSSSLSSSSHSSFDCSYNSFESSSNSYIGLGIWDDLDPFLPFDLNLSDFYTSEKEAPSFLVIYSCDLLPREPKLPQSKPNFGLTHFSPLIYHLLLGVC